MKKLLVFCFVLAICWLQAGVMVPLPDGRTLNLYSDYYALIIGNSDYQYFPKLKGVKQDVKDIKAMFDRLAIPSEVRENLSGQQMLEVLNQFIERYGLNQDRGLIVYYAGHGYTEGTFANRQVGYIVPVDAPLYSQDKALFRQRSVSMNQIKELASLIQSRHVLMIFDSCFAGTIFRGNPGIPKAIEAKVAEPVRQFITAGDADEEVPDASIFKSTLKKGLEDGDADTNGDGFITGQELGFYLNDRVANYSGGSQHPQYGKLNEPDFDRGDFVFALAKPLEAKKVTTPPLKPEVETVWLYGSLEVETNQAGDLYLNGEKLQSLAAGQKAKINKLVTGDYTVELRTSEGSKSQQVSVIKDQTQSLAFKFEKKAQPAVTTPPAQPATTSSSTLAGMVYVEGGSFNMGSNDGDDDEKPVHKVTVSSFYIGKHEVTQKEWRDVMGSSPSRFKGDDKPVEQVSWYDAIEYCNKRSLKEGLTPCYTIDKTNKDPNNTSSSDKLKWTVSVNWQANGYRLPTEAEWEYAARGGNKSKGYSHSGSNDLGSVAWYYDNSYSKGENHSDYGTHKVGTKAANELGIYDMSGNVWEWCWDWYDEGYYAKSQSSDPIGAGSGSYRVIRGGSWYGSVGDCRVADRGNGSPDDGYCSIGFRVSRAIW